MGNDDDENRLSETVFSDEKGEIDNFKTKLERFALKDSTPKGGGVCDPLFFKPNDHMAHMGHMEINDHSYLEHMIPHHQVAIDMSKRLLLHTNHSYLMEFCRKLIIDQQGEIFYMNNLLKKNNYTYESSLLSNNDYF
jgi:uncharacterized protein (DUF305 family)